MAPWSLVAFPTLAAAAHGFQGLLVPASSMGSMVWLEAAVLQRKFPKMGGACRVPCPAPMDQPRETKTVQLPRGMVIPSAKYQLLLYPKGPCSQ